MGMERIVAGNWKMNKDRAGTRALVAAVVEGMQPIKGPAPTVVLAPPFPYLPDACSAAAGTRVHVAAQNCHAAASGAFTGEVSAGMLADIGVSWCIVGHSERRQHQGETDAAVAGKVRALLGQGIRPIYCCGERREDRDAGRHHAVVAAQVGEALGALSGAEIARVVIAYEPVWAIGTGLTATAGQAQDMHAHIRSLLRSQWPAEATDIPLLYGGSCNPANAAELFTCPDVNGGLIGGASLVADQFLAIIRAAAGASGY
jgi:triosephosphate isomerase